MTVDLWVDLLLDVILSPTLWLGVMLAIVYSSLFTVWRGGSWRNWVQDIVTGLVGFGIGQVVGMLLGWTWLRIGDLQFLWGTVTTMIALVIARRLRARLEGEPRRPTRYGA